jgi:hypothetical protein
MWRYLKEAFWVRPHVPGLGHVPVNPLALAGFGVLGLANPGFWLLGLGVETGFVPLLATHPRFQAWVQARDRLRHAARAEERRRQLVAQLRPEARARLDALSARCQRVVDVYRGAPEPVYAAEANVQALRDLQWIYLKLLIGQQFLLSPASQANERRLRAQVEELRDHLERGRLTPAARESKAATLDILERRIRNLERREQTLQEIESDLLRIESQVDLALENATLDGRPQEVAADLRVASDLLEGGLFGDSAEAVADVEAAYREAPPTVSERS